MKGAKTKTEREFVAGWYVSEKSSMERMPKGVLGTVADNILLSLRLLAGHLRHERPGHRPPPPLVF